MTASPSRAGNAPRRRVLGRILAGAVAALWVTAAILFEVRPASIDIHSHPESRPSRSKASEVTPTGPAAVAVTAALSRQHYPYVWGAKGPHEFDCSGLTRWAWAQAGIQLGLDTYTQITNGTPIFRGQVRAGDLIFPTKSWDQRGPGHVQLAISATHVIHAPRPGDVVRIVPMPADYVARRPALVDDGAAATESDRRLRDEVAM